MPITSCLWQQSERHIYPPLGWIRVTDVCVCGCLCVCVCNVCGRFREFVCVRSCERPAFPYTMLLLYFSRKKTYYACLACKFVQIGGRCVRAAERGVCRVVIVYGNCLISLTSASNPLTPTKQSNNYYMTRTQKTQIHTQTPTRRYCRRTFSEVKLFCQNAQYNPCCSQISCTFTHNESDHFDF